MNKKTKEQNSGAKKEKALVPGEWLYFSPNDITVSGIGAFLPEEAYELEIWEEAGVLEVAMGDAGAIDFEKATINPKDEITREFADIHQCKEVFLVTFQAKNFTDAKQVMKRILNGNGGLFCGDTEDFLPMLQAEDEK